MIKRITFIFGIFCSAQLCFAQNLYDSSIGVKFMSGIAFTTTETAKLAKNPNTIRSFLGGIEYQKNVYKNKLYLRPSMFLYKRGFRSDLIDFETPPLPKFLNSGEDILDLSFGLALEYKIKGFYIGFGPSLHFFIDREAYLNSETIKDAYAGDSATKRGAFSFLGYEFKLKDNLLFSLDCQFSVVSESNHSALGLGAGVKYVFFSEELE